MIVTSSNWQDKMTKQKLAGSFDMSQAGTAPNVEVQLMSLSSRSSATRMYYTPLMNILRSDWFVCSFQIKMSTGGDELYFYAGGTSSTGGVSSSVDAAYVVTFNVYQNKIYLKKAGNILASADFAGNGKWEAASVSYTKGTSNTFVVSWKGNNVITYSDNDNANWVGSSGNYWGFGAWDGTTPADMFLRDVSMSIGCPAGTVFRQIIWNMCSITSTVLDCY